MVEVVARLFEDGLCSMRYPLTEQLAVITSKGVVAFPPRPDKFTLSPSLDSGASMNTWCSQDMLSSCIM